MGPQTPPQAIKFLWTKKFFESARSFGDIKVELGRLGCNPSDQNLQVTLTRASFLRQRGARGSYTYIQKYAPQEVSLDHQFLSEELMRALASDFETEISDLQLNFGKSGTCTAFLLRKILEKLIFIAFAKNDLGDKLKDGNGDLIGLKAMLKMCTAHKVNGKPFLMPKTAKEIEGVKFLGDTSAHNPLINVKMQTIIPIMPFITTAYEELSKKLRLRQILHFANAAFHTN
jgi:hypothetical protein